MLDVVDLAKKQRTLRQNAAWALSNLCRGKPMPLWESVSPALGCLVQLLYSPDRAIIKDACFALACCSDGPNDRIQGVIDAGACNQLVRLLDHPDDEIATHALRAVGNIVTGDDRYAQAIAQAITYSFVPVLLAGA